MFNSEYNTVSVPISEYVPILNFPIVEVTDYTGRNMIILKPLYSSGVPILKSPIVEVSEFTKQNSMIVRNPGLLIIYRIQIFFKKILVSPKI